ncbi:MAG: CDP-alcohol phosphatidyltransferase family protein [Acidobacteriota bacterium]|nr:CDP-alcohol phosphatidyltransferase family protein [Acidobacteriota bacterium]
MTLTLPNLLSMLRMGLVPLFIIAVMNGHPGQALVLMIVAGITDFLDGVMARRLEQQTLLGSYLDPIADKLLLTSAYVVLAVPGIHPGVTIPVWVTVLVLARDISILGIALVLSLTVGKRRFPPTWLSKVNTAVQVAAVLLVLVSGLWSLAATAALIAVHLAGLSTVLSGLQYGHRVARWQSPPADGAAPDTH